MIKALFTNTKDRLRNAWYADQNTYIINTLNSITDGVVKAHDNADLIQQMDQIFKNIFDFFMEYMKRYISTKRNIQKISREFWKDFFSEIGCTKDDIKVIMGLFNDEDALYYHVLSVVMVRCWGYHIRYYSPAGTASGYLSREYKERYNDLQELGIRILDNLLNTDFKGFCSNINPLNVGWESTPRTRMNDALLYFMIARLLNTDVRYFMHLLLIKLTTEEAINITLVDMQRKMVNNLLSVFFSTNSELVVNRIRTESVQLKLPLGLFSSYPKNISSMMYLPRIESGLSFKEHDPVVQTIKKMMKTITIETKDCTIDACGGEGEFVSVQVEAVPGHLTTFGTGCTNSTCESKHPVCQECASNTRCTTKNRCAFCKQDLKVVNISKFITQLKQIQISFVQLQKNSLQLQKCRRPLMLDYYPIYVKTLCQQNIKPLKIDDKYLDDLAELIDICETVLEDVIKTTNPEAETIRKIEAWTDRISRKDRISPTKRPRSSSQSPSSSQSRGNSPKSPKMSRRSPSGGSRKKTLRVKRANRRKSKKQRKSRINIRS